MINDTQFVYAGLNLLNIYDITDDKWTTQNADRFQPGDCQTFDAENKCLYGYNQYELYKYDVNKSETKLYELDRNISYDNCIIIKIGSIHHIIGGGSHPKHEIWDENNPDSDKKLLHEFESLQLARGIFIESKKEILVFGGISDDIYDVIRRYSVDENKWDVMQCKMPNANEGFGCVMTMDERYVITFGGYGGDHGVLDDIFVFDMNPDVMKWSICKLKCPEPGFYGAVIVPGRKPDDHLIHAFIRFGCVDVNVKHIPTDIISLIDLMHGNGEKVHLFECDHTDHYCISVSDILSNC